MTARPQLFADAACTRRFEVGRVRQRAPGARAARPERDHRHRLRTIRSYDYEDAATLLEDFWKEADQVLKERGSIP